MREMALVLQDEDPPTDTDQPSGGQAFPGLSTIGLAPAGLPVVPPVLPPDTIGALLLAS